MSLPEKKRTMNDNARKWVKALRSGRYRQGKKVLCRYGYYCCLGVACLVYLEDNPGALETKKVGNGVVEFDSEDIGLPQVVRKWLGLSSVNGAFDGNCLTNLNDDGISFSELADIIESEPNGLFISSSNRR